jgi:hypothetical protein
MLACLFLCTSRLHQPPLLSILFTNSPGRADGQGRPRTCGIFPERIRLHKKYVGPRRQQQMNVVLSRKLTWAIVKTTDQGLAGSSV